VGAVEQLRDVDDVGPGRHALPQARQVPGPRPAEGDGEPDAGQERLDPRLSSYVMGRVRLMENMSLVETLYVQPRLTRFSDVRVLNETLLTVEPNERFTFSMGFVLTYDADPPATVSRFDTQLRSAMGVKF